MLDSSSNSYRQFNYSWNLPRYTGAGAGATGAGAGAAEEKNCLNKWCVHEIVHFFALILIVEIIIKFIQVTAIHWRLNAIKIIFSVRTSERYNSCKSLSLGKENWKKKHEPMHLSGSRDSIICNKFKEVD